MLTVFNKIPLRVHAVFCDNNYYIIVFPLHVHCIHLARGMMRMRFPSISIAIFTDPAGGKILAQVFPALQFHWLWSRICACAEPAAPDRYIRGTGTGAGIPRYVRGMRSRDVPIMPKELPINYSADNSYYSQRIYPLFYYTF